MTLKAEAEQHDGNKDKTLDGICSLEGNEPLKKSAHQPAGYLAGCGEELGRRLLPSDRHLDRQAVRHADTRRLTGVDPALPRTAIGGRHGVDAGEHVQPLQGEGRRRERVGGRV